MINALHGENVFKIMVKEFTTSISVEYFNGVLILFFNKLFEVNKFIDCIIFFKHEVDPA